MMEASIALSQQEASAKVSTLPNTGAGTASVDDSLADEKQGGRRILYPVLFTVILSTCIAAGAYLYTSGIDDRLGVLETITINQTNELAEIRSRVFSSSLQEGRYASLNARLQALTDAFGTLESKLDTVISGKPVAAGGAQAKAIKAITETAATGGVEKPISITPKVPVITNTKTAASASSRVSGELPRESLSANKPGPGLEHPERAGDPEKQPGLMGTSSVVAAAAAQNRAETSPEKMAGPAPARPGSLPDGKTAIGNKAGMADEATVMAKPDSGPWIINLLSSRKKQDTDRLARIAEGNGIPVVQSRAIVKGKEYWRLQITGFRNAKEAKNYAIPVKKKLGIKDVWIFRQKN
jgi:hypothetical protein